MTHHLPLCSHGSLSFQPIHKVFFKLVEKIALVTVGWSMNLARGRNAVEIASGKTPSSRDKHGFRRWHIVAIGLINGGILAYTRVRVRAHRCQPPYSRDCG